MNRRADFNGSLYYHFYGTIFVQTHITIKMRVVDTYTERNYSNFRKGMDGEKRHRKRKKITYYKIVQNTAHVQDVAV